MKSNDTEFEEHVITKVEDFGDGWGIHQGSCVLCIPKYNAMPKVGDVARFYGRGFGFPVRGVDVNGVEVYYRTAAEDAAKRELEQAARDMRQKAEYAASRDSYTAKINALPGPCQQRLFQFRDRNSDFGWKFEGYELTCSEIAARIAAACERRDSGDVKEWFERFRELDYKSQVSICGPDDGWSGNMFSFATRQAWLLVTNPQLVPQDHGALCVLVGCDGFKACDSYWGKHNA
jgi:hypothetical protein